MICHEPQDRFLKVIIITGNQMSKKKRKMSKTHKRMSKTHTRIVMNCRIAFRKSFFGKNNRAVVLRSKIERFFAKQISAQEICFEFQVTLE